MFARAGESLGLRLGKCTSIHAIELLLYLQVLHGVPVMLKEDDSVGSSEIEA